MTMATPLAKEKLFRATHRDAEHLLDNLRSRFTDGFFRLVRTAYPSHNGFACYVILFSVAANPERIETFIDGYVMGFHAALG
jgi:hypothetical protein